MTEANLAGDRYDFPDSRNYSVISGKTFDMTFSRLNRLRTIYAQLSHMGNGASLSVSTLDGAPSSFRRCFAFACCG